MNNVFWRVIVKYSFIILTITLFLTMGVILKVIFGDPEQLAYNTCSIVPQAIEKINDNRDEITKLEETQTHLDNFSNSLNLENSTIEKNGRFISVLSDLILSEQVFVP